MEKLSNWNIQKISLACNFSFAIFKDHFGVQDDRYYLRMMNLCRHCLEMTQCRCRGSPLHRLSLLVGLKKNRSQFTVYCFLNCVVSNNILEILFFRYPGFNIFRMRHGVLSKATSFLTSIKLKVIFRKFLRRSSAVQPGVKLTPVKANRALRFKSADGNLALLST